MSEMRDQARERDWDQAGRQVDAWLARFRADRDARHAKAAARQDERDDEIREYIHDIVTACITKPGPPAYDSMTHHRGSIAWYLRSIADDE